MTTITKKEQELLDSLLIYDQGETVTNVFSGKSVELDGQALALYDFIKGGEMVGIENFGMALSLFRKLYPDAYMVLLDQS